MSDSFQKAEKKAMRTAIGFAGLAFVISLPMVAALARQASIGVILGVSAIAAILVYVLLTRRVRRRRHILSRPFPAEWEIILQQDVVFYRALNPAEKDRFRRLVQVFVAEKPITGIKMKLDVATKVLAAASAIIPIFGFPEWEWGQIREVLIYPERFNEGFSFGDTRDHATLGMVGAGSMNGIMILSKPDLLQGFRNPGDKRNVGIHEFAHLVDKTDGTIDGIPAAGLDRASIGPWIELVRVKMREVEAGKSDINPYALTNEAEFFAVAAEYFFERPGVMRQKHPKLYAALESVFKQNLTTRIKTIREQIQRGRPRFGRNSPCPCGSGIKFKKCCRK